MKKALHEARREALSKYMQSDPSSAILHHLENFHGDHIPMN